MARLLGDLPHAVQERQLPLPERLGPLPSRRLGLGLGRHGLDLGGLLGLELLGSPLAPLVVGAGRGGEQVRLRRGRNRLRAAQPTPLPLPLDCLPVDLQRAGKGLDRGEQSLLQADHEQARRRLSTLRGVREALLPCRSVLVQKVGQDQLRRVGGEPVDREPDNLAPRKTALHLADVLLDAADHHVFKHLLAAHLDAAGEAVRVEQLEERGEAVRVAVVRRRGEEEPVLETVAEVADRAGELGLDPVAAAARWSGVVGLVQYEQAAW